MVDVEVGSQEVAERNEFIRMLMQSADLHMLQPGVVYAAYEGVSKGLGLFYLFLPQKFLETVCRWKNDVLQSKKVRKYVANKIFMVTWVLRW